MTNAPALKWTTVAAGHYTSGEFTILRDAQANNDNRWSLRYGTKVVSAHRLLASAKRVAATMDAGSRLAATADERHEQLHADALIDNDRRDRFAAQQRRGGEPELFEPGTPVLISTTSRDGIPIDLQPGIVTNVVRGIMHITYTAESTVRGTTMALRHTYVERVDEQPAGAIRIEVNLPSLNAKLARTGKGPITADDLARNGMVPMTAQPEQQHAAADEPVALPTPAARPTPPEAIAAYYNQYRAWPTASAIVQRGADLDELHHAEGRREVERYQPHGRPAVFRLPVPNPEQPIAVDDVVTVEPHRESRQFDVVNLDDIDGVLVRVRPRNPRDEDDAAPRWVSAAYTNRVPAELIEPVADDDEQPECEGHESLDGAHMGETVYCDGSCVVPRRRKQAEQTPPAPAFVDPWAGAATPEPAAGDDHLRDAHGAMGPGDRCVDAVAGTGQPVHVVVDPAGLVRDGHDVDQCPRRPAPSVADMLRPAMPAEYTRVLTHLLSSQGFTAPAGIDAKVPDDANPEPFLIHDPTGIAVGVHERCVRLSYPAEHAGEGDGDIGTAWLDLAYGTSFETVADVAVGLVMRLMRRGHLDHMRGVAESLRGIADADETGDVSGDLRRAELLALADQLAPADAECKAAGYARRATAVMFGTLRVLLELSEPGRQWATPPQLRNLALNAAEALNAPEPTVDELVEHLATRKPTITLVANDAGTADADTVVDTLTAAGWQLAPEPEYVAGKRVRYLSPPAAWSAGVHPTGDAAEAPLPEGAPRHTAPEGVPFVICKLHGADCRPAQNGRPCSGMPTDEPLSPQAQALLDAGGITEPDPLIASSVSAAELVDAGGYLDIYLAQHTDEPLSPQAQALLDAGGITEPDPLIASSVSADELVDAGGYLGCGCHGSAREHSCGPSAPETFNPAAEV